MACHTPTACIMSVLFLFAVLTGRAEGVCCPNCCSAENYPDSPQARARGARSVQPQYLLVVSNISRTALPRHGRCCTYNLEPVGESRFTAKTLHITNAFEDYLCSCLNDVSMFRCCFAGPNACTTPRGNIIGEVTLRPDCSSACWHPRSLKHRIKSQN